MTTLEQRIADLENRLMVLEQHHHTHAPLNPYKPFQPSLTSIPNHCTQCGMYAVSGYVCPRNDCPTKVTC